MKPLVFACGALLLISCSDEPTSARTPTAPPTPSFSRSTAAPRGLSTVCLSYMTQLANTHDKLEKVRKESHVDAKAEEKLAKKVESFEKLVTDACR